MNEVDNYIAAFPADVQVILRKIRSLIKQAAPGAEEGLSYGMPAYKTNKRVLVYFAGYKKHIGFYATPSGHREFSRELAKYKQGRGSVQFPLDQPVPYDLIRQMVEFRVLENESHKPL